MAFARRALRERHPGIEPLSTVDSPTGGSVYGPDTRAALVGRRVLLLCTLPTPPFLLPRICVAAVGWSDLRRAYRVRAQRRQRSDECLSESRGS